MGTNERAARATSEATDRPQLSPATTDDPSPTSPLAMSSVAKFLVEKHSKIAQVVLGTSMLFGFVYTMKTQRSPFDDLTGNATSAAEATRRDQAKLMRGLSAVACAHLLFLSCSPRVARR